MISINKKNIFGFVFLLLSAVTHAEVLMQPTSYSKDLYKLDILDGKYNKTIDHPNKFLDFKYGDRVANTSQITNAILSWAEQSERLQVVEYAKSHEGRSLFALYISSPKNINRLDEIKSNVGLLSDARNLKKALKRDNVIYEYKEWENLWHVFQMESLIPEAQESFKMIGKFLNKHIS